jgi:ergothioneine biosynthesis protein EgtC
MCRFLAYKGAPILLDELVFKPKNSLIRQSYDAREIEEPLNGDGFGIGWYVPEVSTDPAVFVSMTPAWSNRNLKSLAPRIRSSCVFAHVRAASVGDISEANCHPFSYKEWMCMHNGGIEDFPLIKRDVRRRFSDEMYHWIKGQTDSEHFFALVLDRVRQKSDVAAEDIIEAVEMAIASIAAIKRDQKVKAETYLNTAITNGKFLVCTRYCSDPAIEPLSLYYSTGARYVCQDGVCHMVSASPGEASALVVSERLTDLRDDWKKVPANHFVVINEDASAFTRPIKAAPAPQAAAG